MPTASRTAVCSLTTPAGYSSGIDQPPNSASLAPERDVPLVQRRGEQVGASWRRTMRAEPTAARRRDRPRQPRTDPAWLILPPGDVRYTPAQGQPRQDPSRRRRRRRRAARKALRLAPGGEEVAKAYGRKLRAAAVDARLHRQGRRGRQGADRRARSPPRCWSSSASGKAGDADVAVRRAAGAAARAVTNAASVALALPADEPELVRAVAEGCDAGRLHVHGLQASDSKDPPGRPGEVVVLTDSARKQEAVTALRGRPRSSPRPSPRTRDWVNTPPGDLTPADVRRRRRRRDQGAARAAAAEGRRQGASTRPQLAELGCGGILGVGAGLGRTRRGWSS